MIQPVPADDDAPAPPPQPHENVVGPDLPPPLARGLPTLIESTSATIADDVEGRRAGFNRLSPVITSIAAIVFAVATVLAFTTHAAGWAQIITVAGLLLFTLAAVVSVSAAQHRRRTRRPAP